MEKNENQNPPVLLRGEKTSHDILVGWLETSQPEWEECCVALHGLVMERKRKATLPIREQEIDRNMATLADYMAEFLENDCPIKNGWVGSDGLP